MIDTSFLLERQNRISLIDHQKKYCQPEFLTSCFIKNVPILNYVDWQIIEIKEGFCKSIIPYEKHSKNQNSTHQAALYLLAADYTGGIAVGNHIKLPSFGIHPIELYDDFGIIFFTIHSEVKYKKISTNNMIATCHINEEERAIIQNSFYKKGRVIKVVDIDLENDNGELLGKVQMKYLISLMSLEDWEKRNNHHQ